MRILDLSAGYRGIWFDKNHPLVTFVDKRPEVKPNVVCDSRQLPEEIGDCYSLVVFDPPHVNFGKNSNMSRDYGHHTADEIIDIIERTAKEAHRVTLSDALMAFKWNDHDTSIESVLRLMEPYWEPLFGHAVSSKIKHQSDTRWVMLLRKDIP